MPVGLTLDDVNLHADRIRLWENFNHAWLALGRKQKECMESGGRSARSQNALSRHTIHNLMEDLTRLCDGIERHGLVDYQYGVWEERIIDGEFNAFIPVVHLTVTKVFIDCINMFPDTEDQRDRAQ